MKFPRCKKCGWHVPSWNRKDHTCPESDYHYTHGEKLAIQKQAMKKKPKRSK